ncbi:MAG: aldose 1-epimerase family protein [Clostridia bacterium]|nr:aldose 1-epimerase family protein [Clostridia bacterium]
MLYTIKNDVLTVSVSDFGAELQSVIDANGKERIWQGDPAFWGRRSPVLFPFCGRIYGGKATADGIPCDIPQHGFFRDRTAAARKIGEAEIVFTEVSDADTIKRYPYPFRMEVRYRLEGLTLSVEATVVNTGEKTMYYAYGAHPGFTLDAPTEQYSARFAKKQAIRQVDFTADACYPVGGSSPFPIKNGDTIPLSEAQFSVGSFFLCEMPDTVTLRKGDRALVTLSYPDFPYLGFWKVPDAKFLCIEPWCSLPAYEGETVEFSARPDFLRLAAGERKTHAYTITFY